VTGVVQGVGFRPFIYRIARQHGVAGTVCNTSEGVRIEIEGAVGQLDAFRRSFDEELPPLAQVTSVKTSDRQPRGLREFTILPSTDETAHEALIPPDVSVCRNCLRELHDPADHRHGYAFINCTDCGPRYTIIVDVPYDRPKTAMADFPMCDDCLRDYRDPADRRFHAEATCCPVCGPRMMLFDNARRPIAADDPIAFAREQLAEGRIVAVKGIGGFHLAVDPANAEAVEELRRRKGRGLKPFALMAPSIDAIRTFCQVDDAEAKLLESPERPIVLLRKAEDSTLAEGIAPFNNRYGVMLPYTPLHYLLLGGGEEGAGNGDRSGRGRHRPAPTKRAPTIGFAALVMTSANMADEPIVIDDDAAFGKLGGVADYFLTHNRRILYRTDDSIAKVVGGRRQTWRRSRGYVPRPVMLSKPAPPILACGALMKNTIALTRGRDVFISQHMGDVDSREGIAFFEETVEHLTRMLGVKPETIVHDLHPEYLSTRYALESPIPRKIGVQHHHAHVASCQCEHGITDRDVIGFALDGTGYGLDGTIWGGEVFVGRPPDYERAAHIECVPMPGGEMAVKQPWRMAVSHMLNAIGPGYRSLPLPFIRQRADVLDDIERMIAGNLNSPPTSSCGRFFDAVSAMLGLCEAATFEGEPAVRLEMAATPADAPPYQWEVIDGSPLIISPRNIVRGIADDIASGVEPGVIAWRFHRTLIELFADVARRLRAECGLNTVALGGGVFLNEILLTGLAETLHGEGFDVFWPQQVPPGDGGISLGQIAMGMMKYET